MVRCTSLLAGTAFALCFASGVNAVRAQTIGIGQSVQLGGSFLDGSKVNSASAVFTLVSGTEFSIALSNTSTFAKYNNPDILGGVFFDLASNLGTAPQFATNSNNNTNFSAKSIGALANAGTCGTTCTGAGPFDVGKTWDYGYSAAGWSGGGLTTPVNYGAAAPNYGSLSFSGSNVNSFNSSAPSYPPTGKQLALSIVGTNYDGSNNGNNDAPLVLNTVNLVFSLTQAVTSLSVSKVFFTYGTSPDSSFAGTVPEPATLAVLATGVAGLGMVRRRFRKSKQA